MRALGIDLAWRDGPDAPESGVVALGPDGRVVDAGWTVGIEGVNLWIQIISDARNIDNHVAYMRSAWEGAQAWVRFNDDSCAQAAADHVSRSVRIRKGLEPYRGS